MIARHAAFLLPVVVATAAPVAAQRTPDAAGLERVVDRFNAARGAFDPAALAATLAPGFEEISPGGDIDDRARVLGFYAADQRRPAPAIERDERRTALRPGFGVTTERVSFRIARPDGTTATRSLRARYVGLRRGADWLLVSAQYTPIPSGPAPSTSAK
ncbi:nuclear transport factor 2 family protein [Sphingomonas sp. A2-49]|uniref:nuclear transport factor 2 family protein n=1 Tax=Sphingomonas sp. A2-49 TaxID=1391375 RepID=UPI0021D38834|nr:nuclear transport factor 2 family protein [Sphingomonas sp. A2-49]MCU6454645.1 nuclear transport factor 2 family protein [Sphingomonas sp. A2-49]